MSGLDVRTISDIERGRTIRPHRSTVDALARALDRDDLGYEAIRARRLAQARVPGARSVADGQVSGARQQGPRTRLVEVFPVAIGHYADADLADSDTQAQVGRLIDLLAPFGGQHRPWKHPARGRGADAVQRRLREWTCPQPTAGSSVLYWAGHGWSDGSRIALAHAESPAVVGASGINPLQLAEAIRARQAIVDSRGEISDGGGWAMVIIEASHATQIADAVMAALHGPGAPGRLLVVAADGTGPTGRFTSILANLLADTYRAEQRILLRDLAAQLERLLGPRNVHQRAIGDTALARVHPPAASWMSAPVETIRCLEDVLPDLSPDERGHFVVKAQGAENGELSWFFEGRETELAQLCTWLHNADSGMLVVTGRAGSGKSALLGTLLVRSLPALRDALARRGLVAAPGPGSAEPPASVFDAVIHLSGLDLAQAVARIAAVAGLASSPSPRSSQPGVAVALDFLADSLRDRTKPFTVLADALDECVDAADVARSLLARLAALPGVRIVVGTRASTSEAPDVPAADENLLEALGSIRPIRSQVIRISRDRAAIQRYVTGRLRAARDYGVAGRAVPHLSEVSDENIDQVAAEVAAGEQEFLFARLAVYELIADPRLLSDGLTRSRNRLLRGTHQDLFGRAVHRLADHDDRYPILMRALSLARGAGLPEADGIWAVMADALAPGLSSGPVSDPSDAASWASAISGLLSQAVAYITVDTAAEPGPPTRAATVYRLAHRTFAEHFTRHSDPGQVGGDCRRLAAIALLRAAQATATSPGHLPGYLVNHLSGHVADADLWDDLQSLPHVLDRIDPGALTADAIRTLLGRRPVPPPLAGLIGARDTLAGASPADRPGLRQLATTSYSARHVIGEPVLGWGVAAAQAGHSTLHIGLSGHTSTVNMVLSLTLAGRVLLASCGDDGTIRLWDPLTATPVGVPMKGHTSSIDDICVLSSRDGRPLLAGAGEDGTIQLWNPVSGHPVGPVLAGHAGPVWSMCVLRGAGAGQSPILASAGEDGTVRLWDTGSGRPAGPVLTGHDGGVLAVCARPGARPDQPELLVSAASDGTVRVWDVAAGVPASPVITATGPVRTVCVVPGGEPGQSATLASAGLDGAVQLWQATTGHALGEPLISSTQAVSALAACTKAIGDCVSLHQDGTIRTWTAATARQAAVISSPDVSAITTLVEADHLSLLSGDIYGRLHLTDPCTGREPGPPLQLDHPAVLAVCPLPGRRGETPVAVAAGSGTITIVTAGVDGRLARGPELGGPAGPIRALCQIAGPRGPQLAGAGSDGVIWLWDLTAIDLDAPDPDLRPSPPVAMLTGHRGRIWSLAAVPSPPGPPDPPGQPGQRTAVLASAGADNTVRLWDPAAGTAVGQPLTGHTDQVRAVIAVRCGDGRVALASGGHDGTVRLWDLTNRTQHAVAPLGIPVHALLQSDPDPASAERTGDGATITVGLRTGILALDLHRDLFHPASLPREHS